MSQQELLDRLERVRAMAEQLRELQAQAARERSSLSPTSEPRLEAALRVIEREVQEAADAAEVVARNPELVAG